MSMGGDFYAVSDSQLKRLLNGTLEYSEFLRNELEEKPQECYAKGERVWYQINELLSREEACGVEQTFDIPEMTSYSFSDQVAATAKRLANLGDEEIRDRHSREDIDEPVEFMLEIIRDLKDFYQRAAENNNAVLFRVT